MVEAGADADSVVTRPGPYQHGVASVPVLARLVDAACDGVDDPLTAAWRVPKLAEQYEPSIEPSAAVVVRDMLLYVIRTAPVDTQPEAVLEPLDGSSPLPPALRRAGDDIRALWLGLAHQVNHPVAQARCWDIVFTLGLIRNKRDAAERATSAYLACVDTTLAPRHRATSLVRGWTLARKVGLTDLERKITAAMLIVVADALDEAGHPWAVIPLLSVLIAPPPRGKAAVPADPGIDRLLDRALETYHEIEVVADVATLVRKRAVGDRDRIERANRRQIGLMLAAAEAATEPMVIRKLFADAASTARRLGVADMERTAVAGLQTAPRLNWQTSGFEVTLPAVYFDRYLPGFDDAADWRDALAIWLNTEAPSGRWEDNQKNARRVQHAAVIQSLVSTVVFRGDDLPARTVVGEDEVFKRTLVEGEAVQMGARGVFLGNALYMIASRFGIPPLEEVEAFLLTSGGDPALVKTLAEALELFWVGKYTASAHLAVPKIEAAVRALLLELDEPLYRTQIGDTPGQFPGLGSLLPGLLNNGFDPDWERFLRTSLLGDGNNIRNLIAHGFAHTVHPVDAALALRACAVVVLLTNQQAVARDAAFVQAGLADPVRPRPRRRLWRRLAAAAQAARFELGW